VIYFLFLKLLIFSQARSEYRAYELTITNTKTSESRVVVTTLDHLQYPGYYPLKINETAQIRSTWMCKERSDYFEPICKNNRLPANSPSGQNATGATGAPAP